MKKFFFIISLIFIEQVNAQTASNYTIIVTSQPSCSTCCDGVASISSLNSSCMAYNYSWSNGASSQTTSNCCAGTTYTATITGSCGTEVQVCSVSFMTTDINHFSKENKIKVSPNPSSGSFVIEPNTSETQILQIFDVTGKMVLNQNINGKTNIDVSNIDNGMYFIQVKTNENISTQRIIVQH
jgi:hypothetical protein